MNSVPAQMNQYMRSGPQAQIWAFRQAAFVLRDRPTLGIDLDLVAWALRMADLLEQRATLIEQSRSPDAVAETLMRGWNGDPFGVVLEMGQAEKALVAAIKKHKQDWNYLRAALTARYKIQFP